MPGALRLLHKWVGLLLGLQFAVWALSGAVMALIDHHEVSGQHARRPAAPALLDPAAPALDLARLRERLGPVAVEGLRLRTLLDRAVYEVATPGGVRLLDAGDGTPVPIDEALARRIAEADYAGAGRVRSAVAETAPTRETRKRKGPVWRVDFDDAGNTTIYVAADTGRVLERRNDSWRLWDFFWMLHIMDYAERESFNHPLIILAAAAALWLSVSGLILAVDSFTAADLNPALALRRLRGAGVPVSVRAGGTSRSLSLPPGASYFDGLAGAGIRLPSNCGGGGSCGLCRVELGAGAPVTEADRRHVPPADLERGVRLACRHAVAAGAEVGVPDGALDAEGHGATVAASCFLGPFIKEVRLRLDGSGGLSYRAGQFVQLQIPAYAHGPDRFDVPEAWAQDWRRLELPDRHAHPGGLRRAYSLATHPGEAPGELVLNVRFVPPAVPGQGPCGAGSAYVFGLRPGDRVRLFGPFGSFAASATDREIVAIGGGAGMAPLRAIVRDELLRRRSPRRITYWYGARSARDILYREEFERLAADHPTFTWAVSLSEPGPADGWTGPVGPVHEAVRRHLLARHTDPAGCEFLVCGPPAMLAATLSMLAELGVPRGRIAFDDFGI